MGKKFQLVVYNKKADYEGVVNLKNDVTDGATKADLVYWVTGLIASFADTVSFAFIILLVIVSYTSLFTVL